MLFKIDSLFGHVIEEREDGTVVYRDDGSLVDANALRPCLGCKAKCNEGEHDPCIANLPGTLNACCGHGLALTPVNRNPNGYVSLTDGRTMRFLGDRGGELIRKAVDAALGGEDLPEGFAFDEEKMWWAGLSQEQIALVHAKIPLYIAKIVEAVSGTSPTDFVEGDGPWWTGLSDEQKDRVWGLLSANHSRFVASILEGGPGAGAPEIKIASSDAEAAAENGATNS